MGDVSTTAYLTIHNMCCWMIDQYGSINQKEKYLPSLCSMETMSSYCLTEPNSGSDAGSLRTIARTLDGGKTFTLSGEKAFISGGGNSDVYLIMARVMDNDKDLGITCFIVEKNSEGLSFGKNEIKMGWNTQPTRAVIMDSVKVTSDNILGSVGEGFKIAMQGLDGGRINIATCSVGGAQQCLNMAGEYLHTRKQFGKTLSNFQYLQFKLADMATRVHASRLMVRSAATQLGIEKSSHSTAFCAMAKRFATDECFDVVNDSLQMFGGYGYLNEYGVERYLRDLRVHCILEGTNEVMRLITSRYYLNLYKDGGVSNN
ncbi:acyl-CoA dehydrogenase family member [Naegleria gruberi]|uniref:Acyl-CoA dehydrogenase family member n=1 Tax=Naegleria gruberi TaxID=5762 RepID=D2VKA5_NAEGR|nr:acyl-CoA dehydrogenase family member [Naegleria gruberi]EFC42828.1 acyl-CoA dehydrogenase family member [Naegleria gruberi]|eukprot:XP_002675572.1 acyl-CoA dehydrogenase family member [Naegleria gruberi strain NEG-M]